MFDPHAELRELVGRLEREKIPYALCGAFALAVHGAPRATKDIDILVRSEDLERVERVARACGFTLPALPMTFSTTNITLHRHTKIIDARPLPLDVLVVNESLEPLFAERLRLEWEGGPIQVVSRDGLIVLKTTAGRPQDLVDIQTLMRLEHGED